MDERPLTPIDDPAPIPHREIDMPIDRPAPPREPEAPTLPELPVEAPSDPLPA